MRGDEVRRLAALHAKKADDAAAWLSLVLWGEVSPQMTAKHLECSIEELERLVRDAICSGNSELSLPIEIAEAVAVALKSRKRPGGRPKLTRIEQMRNGAAVMTARMLKSEKVGRGMPPGQAEEEAAEEAASEAGKYGCTLSAPTIRRRMSESDKNL